MEVELIDRMGTDLSVVNAARISFGKRKEFMDTSDEKLIRYLAKHDHWSPFAHTSITFRIKMPIFVAAQLKKHQVGLSWNEISRRYVSDEPEFYVPEFWRSRVENVKQGSSTTKTIDYDIRSHNFRCLAIYEDMLSQGIAPEMARMVLPQNMMTEIYWTGSLYAFARVYKLRTDPTAQWESKQIALMIGKECEKLFPISWKELV
jgi:thymidylate synthase (FAD)